MRCVVGLQPYAKQSRQLLFFFIFLQVVKITVSFAMYLITSGHSVSQVSSYSNVEFISRLDLSHRSCLNYLCRWQGCYKIFQEAFGPESEWLQVHTIPPVFCFSYFNRCNFLIIHLPLQMCVPAVLYALQVRGSIDFICFPPTKAFSCPLHLVYSKLRD